MSIYANQEEKPVRSLFLGLNNSTSRLGFFPAQFAPKQESPESHLINWYGFYNSQEESTHTYPRRGITCASFASDRHAEENAIHLLNQQQHLFIETVNSLPANQTLKGINVYFHSFYEFCNEKCIDKLVDFKKQLEEFILRDANTHQSLKNLGKGKEEGHDFFITFTGISQKTYEKNHRRQKVKAIHPYHGTLMIPESNSLSNIVFSHIHTTSINQKNAKNLGVRNSELADESSAANTGEDDALLEE